MIMSRAAQANQLICLHGPIAVMESLSSFLSTFKNSNRQSRWECKTDFTLYFFHGFFPQKTDTVLLLVFLPGSPTLTGADSLHIVFQVFKNLIARDHMYCSVISVCKNRFYNTYQDSLQ